MRSSASCCPIWPHFGTTLAFIDIGGDSGIVFISRS
jgi:hypothetical protein